MRTGASPTTPSRGPPPPPRAEAPLRAAPSSTLAVISVVPARTHAPLLSRFLLRAHSSIAWPPPPRRRPHHVRIARPPPPSSPCLDHHCAASGQQRHPRRGLPRVDIKRRPAHPDLVTPIKGAAASRTASGERRHPELARGSHLHPRLRKTTASSSSSCLKSKLRRATVIHGTHSPHIRTPLVAW